MSLKLSEEVKGHTELINEISLENNKKWIGWKGTGVIFDEEYGWSNQEEGTLRINPYL